MLRETERTKALEEANQKLWDQTDEVRKLHATMFLSHVLAERQEQLTSQKHAREAEKAVELQHHTRLISISKVSACQTGL